MATSIKTVAGVLSVAFALPASALSPETANHGEMVSSALERCLDLQPGHAVAYKSHSPESERYRQAMIIAAEKGGPSPTADIKTVSLPADLVEMADDLTVQLIAGMSVQWCYVVPKRMAPTEYKELLSARVPGASDINIKEDEFYFLVSLAMHYPGKPENVK